MELYVRKMVAFGYLKYVPDQNLLKLFWCTRLTLHGLKKVVRLIFIHSLVDSDSLAVERYYNFFVTVSIIFISLILHAVCLPNSACVTFFKKNLGFHR